MTKAQVTLQFDPEWRISLVTALLLPALVFLGFWQLERAEEKRLLAHSWDVQRAQAPESIDAMRGLDAASLSYRPVALEGEYLPSQYFLLDNRVQGGVFGYEVLSPFALKDGVTLVLVNRGWIAGDPARLSQPEVVTPAGEVRLTGHVYVAPGRPYLLAEDELTEAWPKTVQSMDMATLLPSLQALTVGPVFGYPVRIDSSAPGALLVDWQIVNVSPEKHMGYAFQWFTMAIVLAFFYILRSSNIRQFLSAKLRKTN